MNYDPNKAIRQALMVARRQITAPNNMTIRGQDHILAYITPREADLLAKRGGSGRITKYGIPAFDDGNGPGGDPSDNSNSMSEASTQDAAGGNTGEGAGPTGAGAGATGEQGPNDTDVGMTATAPAAQQVGPLSFAEPLGVFDAHRGMGIVGGLAGLGLGVPGLGMVASGIGAAIDAERAQDQLNQMGITANINTPQAVANAASMGMFGQSVANQFGNALGFDAFAEAPMSATFGMPNVSAPTPDTSGDPPVVPIIRRPQQNPMEDAEMAQQQALMASRDPMQQPLMLASGGAAGGMLGDGITSNENSKENLLNQINDIKLQMKKHKTEYDAAFAEHMGNRPYGTPRNYWAAPFFEEAKNKFPNYFAGLDAIKNIQNKIDKINKSEVSARRKSAMEPLAKAFSDYEDVINSAHKNENLNFKAMPIEDFNSAIQSNADNPAIKLHKSPVYNNKQSSEYKFMMVNGMPAYARKSNHWGKFITNISNIDDAVNHLGLTEEEAKTQQAQDPYGRIGYKYHNWSLENGDENKKTSQAGYVYLDDLLNDKNQKNSKAFGGAAGGMPVDDPAVQQALDITRQAQPSAPQMAAAVQPQAMPISDPSSTINQYRGTGLSFPEKDNSARLALKAKRENLLAQGKAAGNPANPRMVIRAPKAADGEKQLPDFVVGQLNHKDWTDRHEAILSPSEINQASQWYKRVKNTFDTFYPNDPELSKTMMRAWLVAQQNVSPAGAMNNVLMQREQMLRGDPEETWQAGGMPMPTQAARSVLRQQPIEMGVGQKIADFVDSAEGKPVRSWMGNHPDGGAPFVVDVHTARDTGMVDEELLNHLRRLGYDQDDLSNVKIDLKGSPTEAAYENRGQWGRGLTKHLNNIKWQGKSDWTPDEIQAVGWMGMTKLTRNAEEDSESGLSRNLRRLSFETAPGKGSPWEKKYGQAFSSLSPEQQRDVTHAINGEALKRVAELSGIDVRHVVHGTGAWEKTQSPATVGQALMTQKGGDIAANALGYLLNQTEVWHNRAKPLGGTKNPSGFAIDFIQKNGHELADPAYLQDLWQKITNADPHDIIKGYQPIKLPTGEVGIRAIITKGGEKTKGLIEGLIGQDGSVRKVIEASPHDLEVMGHEAEVSRAVNDWKENPNGEAYMERLVNLLGPNSRAKLADIRTQLEKRLEAHLNEIGSGKSQQGRKSTGKQKAQLEKAGGGFIPKNPDLLNRALRLTAPDRPMLALADLFQRQLRGRPPF